MAETTFAVAGTRGHYAEVLREMEGVRVVGVTGTGDSVGPLVEWCSGAEVYGDYEEMLDRARPEAVVVCGPLELHGRMCAAAVRRGIHVITEKPAAITFEELEELRRVCAQRPGVVVAEMMFSRYWPGFYTAREIIRRGVIGEVRIINTRKSYKLGKRESYYHDRKTYGGTIPWVGSHAIDWILYLADRKFTSVYATHSARCNEGNGSMERSALCHFTLQGDIFASVSIDLFRPGGAKTHGDDWARVVGTKGTMEIWQDQMELVTEAGEEKIPAAGGRGLVRDFVDQVKGRKSGLIETKDTLELTEACLRARLSADEGRVVRFGET